MQSLVITRESGNIPQTLEGRDHYTGLVFLYDGAASIPESLMKDNGAKDKIGSYRSATEAAADGFDTTTPEGRTVQRAFALNPSLVLYVYLCDKTADPKPVVTLQKRAGGDLRQVGVANCSADKATVADMQSQAQTLDEAAMPLSIILSPRVEVDVATLPTDLRGAAPNVSVLISKGEEGDDSVDAIGPLLGVLSARAVNESIAWVRKCDTGLSAAVFSDGTPYESVSQSTLSTLDTAGYIYTRTYPGITGVFFSDSHTMDSATGDYVFIERQRTMDKAVRGTRASLLPELGRPLAFNADGTLRADTLQHLRTVAGKAVEQMEKDGEVSGWAVDVDPAQDVLGTSTVEFSIHAVPMGVMRKAKVSIGYAQSVEQ